MNRPLLWLLGIVSAIILIAHAAGFAEHMNPLNTYLGENKKITGTVDTIPQEKSSGTAFTFKIKTINDSTVSGYLLSDVKVQVTLSPFSDAVYPEISAGDQLTLQGDLSLADGARNPGAFDYALYLRGKSISGLLYVDSASFCAVTGHSGRLKYQIDALRTKISEVIKTNFSEAQGDVILGMFLGEKNISEELQSQFSDAGISHLLAVSGLHVGYLCLLIAWLTALLKRGPKFKLTLLIPTLIFYCLLTGSSVSVIRASLMTALPILGDVFHRHSDALNGLCAAALLILIIWPAQLFSAGFQLSFGAVAAIVFLFRPLCFSLNKHLRLSHHNQHFDFTEKLTESLCLSFCTAIGTFPAVLYHFHTFNLASALSNLVMIPLAGCFMILLLITLPFMLILPAAAPVFAFLPKTLAQLIIDASALLSEIPGLKYHGAAPGLLQCLIIFTIALALSGYFDLFRKKNRRIIAALLAFSVSLTLIMTVWPQPLTITFLDVGQGDAALIETPNGGAYLVDGGGYEGYRAEEKSEADPISEKVLLPALYAKGITHLNGVFITHNHSDHAQGIEEILTKMPVDCIYVTTKYNGTAILDQQTVPVARLCAGMILSTEDGCILQVLWPDAKIEAVDDDEQNDASLIFRLIYGKRSFLFTGDAGLETEKQLSSNLSADLIKIGHHGSSGSTSAAFLEKVDPKVAVISVGRYNTYGHPTEEVLNNIANQKALCCRTDQNGAVVVTTNGEDLNISAYVQ